MELPGGENCFGWKKRFWGSVSSQPVLSLNCSAEPALRRASRPSKRDQGDGREDENFRADWILSEFMEGELVALTSC